MASAHHTVKIDALLREADRARVRGDRARAVELIDLVLQFYRVVGDDDFSSTSGQRNPFGDATCGLDSVDTGAG
jgi:hypothetical protein